MHANRLYPGSDSRRSFADKKGVLNVLFTGALLFSACNFDMSEKDRCYSNADCIGDRICDRKDDFPYGTCVSTAESSIDSMGQDTASGSEITMNSGTDSGSGPNAGSDSESSDNEEDAGVPVSDVSCGEDELLYEGGCYKTCWTMQVCEGDKEVCSLLETSRGKTVSICISKAQCSLEGDPCPIGEHGAMCTEGVDRMEEEGIPSSCFVGRCRTDDDCPDDKYCHASFELGDPYGLCTDGEVGGLCWDDFYCREELICGRQYLCEEPGSDVVG